MPEIRPNSVDLPAPFGPISACREPASTVERHGVDREQLAVAAADVLELEHGASSREPRAQPPAAADEAARQQVDDEDEDAAEDELPVRREHVRELVAHDVVERPRRARRR